MLPQIALTTTGSAEEAGPISSTIRLSLNPAPMAEMVIRFTLTGTAGYGSDYLLLPGDHVSAITTDTFTVMAGAGGATFFVAPVDDPLVEGNEMVFLRLIAATRYAIDALQSQATLPITDNDPPDKTLYLPLIVRWNAVAPTLLPSPSTTRATPP